MEDCEGEWIRLCESINSVRYSALSLPGPKDQNQKGMLHVRRKGALKPPKLKRRELLP